MATRPQFLFRRDRPLPSLAVLFLVTNHGPIAQMAVRLGLIDPLALKAAAVFASA